MKEAWAKITREAAALLGKNRKWPVLVLACMRDQEIRQGLVRCYWGDEGSPLYREIGRGVHDVMRMQLLRQYAYPVSTDGFPYLSPFSTRYGSAEMRLLWSEKTKRLLWRYAWAALAHGQADAGMIPWHKASEIQRYREWVDIGASLEEEKTTRHDVVAELRVFARQCEEAGGMLHAGATSSDIVDNADAMRVQASINLLLARLDRLLLALADRIEDWADRACMGWTHLQNAEITTVGYRLAQYAQDLLQDRHALYDRRVLGKGFKGSVGTASSFEWMAGGSSIRWKRMESIALQQLGDLAVWPVSTQTYPRRQDFSIMSDLATLASSLSKMALDLRLLQSSAIEEMWVSMQEGQVGSSAMPYKRNPVGLENICSLSRLVAANARMAWDNAAGSMLERTLDDSANKRVFFPESFLALDHMLLTMTKVVVGLSLNNRAIEQRIHKHGAFLGIPRLLDELVKAGGDRQACHEHLRIACGLALDHMAQGGQDNLLPEMLSVDQTITANVNCERVFDILAEGEQPSLSAESLALYVSRSVREHAIRTPDIDVP